MHEWFNRPIVTYNKASRIYIFATKTTHPSNGLVHVNEVVVLDLYADIRLVMAE